MLFGSEVLKHASTQDSGRLVRTQNLDLCDERPIDDHGPAMLDIKIRKIKSGFLLELAPHAQIEIDFATDDVIRIGRTARKLYSSTIESMRPHDT